MIDYVDSYLMIMMYYLRLCILVKMPLKHKTLYDSLAYRPGTLYHTISSFRPMYDSCCHCYHHYSYMNRISQRYGQDEIPDLITFLQGSWATPLYHESFPEIRAIISAALVDHHDEMAEVVRELMHAWSDEQADGSGSAAVGGSEGVAATTHTVNTHATPVPVATHAAAGGASSTSIAQSSATAASSEKVRERQRLVSKLAAMLPSAPRELIQIHLLRFLSQHANHLPGFVIPPNIPSV
jgi:hypothetical protein